MMRLITVLTFLLLSFAGVPTHAEDRGAENPRAATGGAQTLDDILARQRGERVPSRERDAGSASDAAAGLVGQLGTRGGASDSEIWEAVRFGTADITVSTGKPVDAVLVQDGGMRWYAFREGPLRTYGGYLLLGTLGALVLFFLLRGRIRIDGGRAGITIERFKAVERFGHWLLAGSFVLLGISGLITLFGRLIIPVMGHEVFSPLAIASKWVHNNVAWPFMLALVLVFVLWVAQNIPNRHDLVWLAKGGGLFSKGVHPPARKFNAGQKIIFWSVIVLGFSVSLSGLSLLFPFELPMFAKTFAALNAIGVGPLVNGGEPLATTLAPHAEMQLATLWHAIVAFLMMAIIFAHIYLGSVGMEGAYDAMGSGHVDLQWAQEHHGLWVEEERAKGTMPAPRSEGATPAE